MLVDRIAGQQDFLEPATGSQGDRVPFDGCPHVGLQPVVGYHVDRNSENVFQLVPDPGQTDQAELTVEVDEQVDVAVGSVVAAGGAAEQAEVADPVPGRRAAHQRRYR